MSRGAPDYSNITVGPPLHRITDMAELAARLGSPNFFDRSGSTLWVESFETGLNRVYESVLGADSALEMSIASSRTGPFSAKCTAGAAVTSFGGFYILVPMYDETDIGVEFSFTKHAWVGYIVTYLYEYGEAATYVYGLRWVRATGNLEYYDDGGNWQETGITAALYTATKLYNGMKLGVDTETHQYKRARLNLHSQLLTGIGGYALDPSYDPHLRVYVQAFGSTNGISYAHVDDVIITQNEPA